MKPPLAAGVPAPDPIVKLFAVAQVIGPRARDLAAVKTRVLFHFLIAYLQ